MNFIEFLDKFPTEEKVIEYFITKRYKKGIKCNHCNSKKVYQRKKTPKVFDCNGCGGTFSVFKGTIFENTTTDLRKWMYAIHLFLNGKKGISGYQLQREIKVTYKTAWRMLHCIRTAMGNKEHQKFNKTIVEMDETYVGGKPRRKNNHDKDDDFRTGRGTKKTPVVGIMDRVNGKVCAKIAFPNKQGKKLSGIQLLGILAKHCEGEDSVIITDEFKGYNIISNKTDYFHLRIDHSKAYTNGSIHTNNIESFWAILKRGIYGIYHHVSVDWLQNYVNEFCFRFNHRKNNEVMFDLVLTQAVL